MRRYPLWKHAIVAVALVLACIYALPSAYPSLPAMEIRPHELGLAQLAAKVDRAFAAAGIAAQVASEERQLVATFTGPEQQLEALALLKRELGSAAIVALSSRSSAPGWLAGLGARAVALGLDLRGGVHFLLQVDTAFALTRFLESSRETLDAAFAAEGIEATVTLAGGDAAGSLVVELADAADDTAAITLLQRVEPRLSPAPAGRRIELELDGLAREQIIDLAVGQNVETLRRRVDELGVAEPIIARQGEQRIVVQLPGLQDTARAKGIIGRRAALEMRGVNERASGSDAALARAARRAPPGTELLEYADGGGAIVVEKRVVLTGDNIVDASYGSDEVGRPAVHLTLDAIGARKIKNYTRERVGEQLAIVLIDRERTEVISAPSIQSELHARFLIHGGGMDVEEANELALLLRSGSLATPIEIVEERAIGPSLGADNIRYGLAAVSGGFVLVALLIALYYGVFGVISVVALVANLLCLTALLAGLGANLTLPGLAGFALTLGMAIDANVLINERIREELASGQSPGLAIEAGYARAFATILDANVTTLIAGLALFALGSGPVRGFAVVLCLGIVTSMFNATVVSRSLADLVYGRKRRLKRVSIG